MSTSSPNVPTALLRGRCIDFEPGRMVVQNQRETREVRLAQTPAPPPQASPLGGIVEVDVEAGTFKVLTVNRTPEKSTRFWQRTLDPRRHRAVRMRQRTESAIRQHFLADGFLETRTPLLVPSPGMEPHIRPFSVGSTQGRGYYLPTSPEFALKRLLAGGLEKIFEITPAFRDEPESTTHLPEFTMLEWYRAYATDQDLMRDTETLVEHLSRELLGEPVVRFQNRTISVQSPWPRYRVRDLFLDLAQVELSQGVNPAPIARLRGACRAHRLDFNDQDTWDDLYFRIWLNVIEPKLPADQAYFVTRYPASQAALSVIDTDADGSRWARRFEAYLGPMELANAFEELTDPIEQRARFESDMRLRAAQYGASFPSSPIDESFLSALTEGMPPSAGIALGVDRLIMCLADESDIRYTFWLPAESSS